MARVHLLPALLVITACADTGAPLPPAPTACADPNYLARDQLDEPWFLRETVIDSNGPFEGQTELFRGQLSAVDGTLRFESDAQVPGTWPIIRSLDVRCENGALIEVESENGAYLEVDWARGIEPRSIGTTSDWRFVFEPTQLVETDTVVTNRSVTMTELGTLTADRNACNGYALALGRPLECAMPASLRIALLPVGDIAFEGAVDDDAFVFQTVPTPLSGDRVTRLDEPIFYLEPDAAPEVIEAAAAVNAAIATVLPSFEIRENEPTSQKPGTLDGSVIVTRPFSQPVGWGSSVSRAVDPKTGRVLAADVYIDLADLDQITEQVRATHRDLAPLVSLATERVGVLSSLAIPPSRAAPGVADRSIETFRRAAQDAMNGTVGRLSDDPAYAILIAGPTWPGGMLPGELDHFRDLNVRIEAMVFDGRPEAARLMGAGYSFLTRWEHPGHGAIPELMALTPDEAAEVVRAGVLRHRMLHTVLHALGLGDNPAASWDGGTSVLDAIVAERQHMATSLGAYDEAALRYLYLDGPRADTFARCAVEDAVVGPTLECAIDDEGTTARASFAHAYGRWLGHYPRTHVVGERFSPDNPFRPAVDAFWRASLAARQAASLSMTDPGFAGSARAIDLLTTTVHAANFAAELIAVPTAGRHCPWPGAQPTNYIPHTFFRDNCDATLPADSAEALAQQQIEVPIGIGREELVGQPDGDFRWTHVGSRIDKLNALWALAFSFPTDETAGWPAVGIVDAVPEAAVLYAKLVDSSPYFVNTNDALTAGDFWCGHFVPRQLIDVTTGAVTDAPPDTCNNPAVIRPELGAPAFESAVFFVQGMGIGDPMVLYEVGVDDQAVDWTSVPAVDLCSFTNRAGTQWRAIASDGLLACRFLESATDAQNDAEVSGSQTFWDIAVRFEAYVYDAHQMYTRAR